MTLLMGHLQTTLKTHSNAIQKQIVVAEALDMNPFFIKALLGMKRDVDREIYNRDLENGVLQRTKENAK